MNHVNLFFGKKSAKSLHASPIESSPPAKMNHVNSLVGKRFAQLADFVEAGDDEMTAILQTADDAAH